MSENKLMAGAGCAEIHFPKEMFPAEGFSGEVHDTPHVRLLVMESGIRAAIVAFELVNVPQNAMEQCREIVAEKTGTRKENIWVHMTHAISTPHANRHEGHEAEMEMFLASLRDAVSSAADQAAASMQPAKLGFAEGSCDVNVNRDVETPFGWWLGLNPDGPSNKTASVLRLDDLKGEPIGVLISYGVKPCAIDNSQMEQGMRVISSDVPGEACRQLEEKFGAPCMFVMSAAADQVPKEQALTDVVHEDGTLAKKDDGVEKGLEIVSRLGTQMAKEVGEIISSAKCTQEAPDIRIGKFSVTVDSKESGPMEPAKEHDFVSDGKTRVLDSDVMVIQDLALVTVMPETGVEVEAKLQKESPFAHTLLMSMTNGEMKYMPGQSAYDRVTWESLSSWLMPGSAEKWVDAAVSELKQLKED